MIATLYPESLSPHPVGGLVGLIAGEYVSRGEDLAFVEAEISALDKRRQEVVAEYDRFRDRVQAQIELVLKDAGVFDVVSALDRSRGERLTRDQGLVQKIEAEMADHAKVRDFLKSRVEAEPAPTPPAPPAPPAVAAPPKKKGPPEYVNGIDVSGMDSDTKGLVRSGNPETLAVLRRRPDLVEPPKKGSRKSGTKSIR